MPRFAILRSRSASVLAVSSRGNPSPLRCARSSLTTYTMAARPASATTITSAKAHHTHTGTCADHSENPGGADGGGHEGGHTTNGGAGGKLGGSEGG